MYIYIYTYIRYQISYHIKYQISNIIHHISYIIYHISYIIYHISYIIYHISYHIVSYHITSYHIISYIHYIMLYKHIQTKSNIFKHTVLTLCYHVMLKSPPFQVSSLLQTECAHLLALAIEGLLVLREVQVLQPAAEVPVEWILRGWSGRFDPKKMLLNTKIWNI